MGVLDSLIGNASEVEAKQIQEEFKSVLIADEEVTRAFQVFRDSLVFTSHRLILVDKQGMTGKKVAYQSIPYKSIVHFTVETAGTFDLDAELKIFLSGHQEPIAKRFTKKLNVYEVQRVLAQHVMEPRRT